MPQLRPEVFLVASGAMSSFVRVVLQALLAAMSQVARRHMRTRLNRGDSNRKTLIGIAKRCPWLLDRVLDGDFNVTLTLSLWMKSHDMTIQMKALCLYFHMVLFVLQNFTK